MNPLNRLRAAAVVASAVLFALACAVNAPVRAQQLTPSPTCKYLPARRSRLTYMRVLS